MFFSQDLPSRNFPGTVKLRLSALVVTATLFPALLVAQNPPQLTLLDPVPALLMGSMVTTNVNTLASKGRAVQGSSADGASEVVLRVPASSAGEQFTFTVINDQGQQSVSAAEDGGLAAIGSTSFTLSQLTVSAVSTSQGPMAFAIYGAPVDFPRPEGQDVNATDRFISLNVLAVDTGLSSSTQVTLLRPPLGLIHGLWGSPASWADFTPLITDPRFTIGIANYSQVIGGQIKTYKPSLPVWALSSVKSAQASSLGFAYQRAHRLAAAIGFRESIQERRQCCRNSGGSGAGRYCGPQHGR